MKKFMTRAAALLGLMAMSTGMPAPTAEITAAPVISYERGDLRVC